MIMGLSEFTSIIRRAKQEEDFVSDIKAVMIFQKIDGDERSDSERKAEAKEIAIHKWMPVVLALKHGLNINGSGGDSIKLDSEKLAEEANIQRDVMFVYDYISYDDICPYGGKPGYIGQPVAPSPGAYNMWRYYRFRENGMQEFIEKSLHRFGPSRNELDKRNSMSDDGCSIIELIDDITKARREAEETVAGHISNGN